jgi:toxin CcdB
MARYDVYTNPDGKGFLLDVQADLLEELTTRVVVPLLPLSDNLRLPHRLNPVFAIDGKPHKMLTNLIAAVPVKRLGQRKANFLDHHDEIVGALDMLFQGF